MFTLVMVDFLLPMFTQLHEKNVFLFCDIHPPFSFLLLLDFLSSFFPRPFSRDSPCDAASEHT